MTSTSLPVDVEPAHLALTAGEILRLLQNRHRLRLLTQRDLIANLALEGWDVHLAAVDGYVSVAHDLACLATRHGEAHAVNNVVETGLELLQQQLTGNAGLARSGLVVCAELGLEREVDALGLLLLAELQAVAYDLGLAGLAVLAWGEVALLNGALVGEALRALEEKLYAVAAAKAADGSCITCHFKSPDFGCRSVYTRSVSSRSKLVFSN